MSVFQAAMPTGSYPSLMSGGVQCTQLYDNADLNDCVPENDKEFQAWVCTSYDTANTMSNTPFANFRRTFYLTAVKTWYNIQNADQFNVTQTLYSGEPKGNSLIWTRSIDGARKSGWSDWKEIVVADGSYPTLGAGYLAKQEKINNEEAYTGWQKIGTVHYADFIAYQVYSCIMLVNGIFRGSAASEGNPKSGAIEIEYRKYNNAAPGDTRIGVLFGDLDSNNFCYNILSNFDMEIWMNVTAVEGVSATFEIVSEQLSNEQNCNIFDFDCVTQSATAPEGAVYAVVRNIASYAESIPVASESVFGGAKMWVDGGKLYIKTE